MFSLPILEHQLVMYVTSDGRDTFTQAFDLSNVPVVTREQADAEDRTKKLNTAMPTLKAPTTGPKRITEDPTASRADQNANVAASAAAATQKYAQQLQQIPEVAAYGAVLKSSPIVALTESETEYVVSAVKHVFKEAVVLQFDIKNTLPDTVLTDVSVVATPTDTDEDSETASPPLEEDFIIPVPKLVTDVPGTAYAAFKRTSSGGDDTSTTPYAATSFTNLLKFTFKEVDPSTDEPEETGYEDDYQVEDLDLTGADYLLPAFAGSFDNVWTQTASTESSDEASETLVLGNAKGVAEATEQLSRALGMQALEGTDVVTSSSTHTLKLFGRSVGGGRVAGLVRMAWSARAGVTVKVNVRSEESGVAGLVIGGVS